MAAGLAEQVVADPSSRTPRWAAAPVVTALVLVGIGLRVWVLTSPLGTLDADEAVSGLMARHVLDGELDRFFWGQVYGGTLEQLLTAGVFAAAGGSSVLALKLVPVALCAACAVVVWRIGLRVLDPRAARLAGALLWTWPAAYVWWSTKSRGFFWLGLLLGLLVLLLALRLAEEPDRRRDWALLGLAAGLGCWETAQVAFLAGPALLWLLAMVPRATARHLPLLAGGAVLGALPWLEYNLAHPLDSLRLLPPAPGGEGTYVERLTVFFTDALPMALGLKVPYTDVWSIAEPLAVVALLAAGAYAAWLLCRPDPRLAPVLLALLALPFLYAAGPGARDIREGRYLLPLLPIACLLLARWVRRWWHEAALATALVGCTAVTLAVMELPVQPRESSRRLPVSMDPLVAATDRLGVRHVFADYWIAYRLAFESQERVVATPFFVDRHPAFTTRVRADPAAAYVYVAGSNGARTFELQAEAAGVALTVTRAGGWVLYQPERQLLPENLPQVQLPDPEPADVPVSNG